MATVDINAKFTSGDGQDNDSKKTMVYTADDNTEYTVLISEAIGESMGFADFEAASTATPLPQFFKMRTVTFSDASGKVKGQYPVGKSDTEIYTEGGTITVPRKGRANGIVCSVTGAQGEKRRFPQANDTGQQGGDNT